MLPAPHTYQALTPDGVTATAWPLASPTLRITTQAVQQRPPDISINQSWFHLSNQSLNLLKATVLDPPPLVRGEKPGETGGKVTCSATERPGAINVAVALSPPSFPSFFPPPSSLLLVPACFSPLPPWYLPAYKTVRNSNCSHAPLCFGSGSSTRHYSARVYCRLPVRGQQHLPIEEPRAPSH